MGFLVRNKFWVGVALVVVVAVFLVVLMGIPAMGANRRTTQELEGRRDTLSGYAKAQYVKNPSWAVAVENRKGGYLGQLEEVKSYLADRDKILEKMFEDPEHPETAPPLGPTRWKTVYSNLMDGLTEKLEERVVRLGSMPLERADYRDLWPTEQEMHQQEKFYWLQKAIVDTMAKLNAAREVVPVFFEFRISGPAERLLSPAHGEKFRPIPWQLRVGLEFENLPRLLYELLDNELGLELTGMSVTRSITPPAGGARTAETAVSRPGGMRVPGSGVGVPTGAGYGLEAMPGAGMEAWMREGAGMMGPLPPGAGMGPREMRPAFGVPGTGIEEVREVLSKTLVEVTLRGYLPDYIGPEEAKTSR